MNYDNYGIGGCQDHDTDAHDDPTPTRKGTTCIGLEDALDNIVANAERGIAPESTPHCVACGSNDIEATDDGNGAFCLTCHATEDSVDWIAAAETPGELIAIWADAPEIEAPALITTQVYRFAQEDAA